MKIAYLALHNLIYHEDFSIYPKYYGAGAAFARYCKEYPDFHIFGRAENFDTLKPWENKANCHLITQDQIFRARNGEPVVRVIPQLNSFDAICHNHFNFWINTDDEKLIQIPWLTGEEPVHEKYKVLLLFNDYQKPILRNPNTVKYYFTLGVNIPDVKEVVPYDPSWRTSKYPFAFFCGRLGYSFACWELAEYCYYSKIFCVLGGPLIDPDDYNRMVTHPAIRWMGEISEEMKIQMIKDCYFQSGLLNWDAQFNLTMILGLGYGKPLIGSERGFLKDFLIPGYNGFFASNKEEFNEAVKKIPTINPYNCYRSVLKYNTIQMVKSVFDAFDQIQKEWDNL